MKSTTKAMKVKELIEALHQYDPYDAMFGEMIDLYTEDIKCYVCGRPADGLCVINNLCKRPLCDKCVSFVYIGWSPFDKE